MAELRAENARLRLSGSAASGSAAPGYATPNPERVDAGIDDSAGVEGDIGAEHDELTAVYDQDWAAAEGAAQDSGQG
eukprot:2673860-Pyramimonas_sp.AAC.1